MNEPLLITRDAHTEHWVLNDPASRNALSDDMVQALFAACARAASDTSLRFIVLAGASNTFCAGGSLGAFAKSIGKPLAAGEVDPLLAVNAGFGELLLALCQLPQIVIAAVDGAAMGGGFGLVCCADFVVASDTTIFATPEVTLGVVPAQIAAFVQWRLGDKAARGMLLGGAKHSALQMQTMGLVDAVVSRDALASEVHKRLDDLRTTAPQAAAATKRLLLIPFMPLAQSNIAQAATEFVASLRSTEAEHGLHAFSKKSKPEWAA